LSTPISETEARLALSSIERHRLQVVAEINVPAWYWFAMAAGWVGLGVISDFGPAWATLAATILFGAAHSSIAPRVISGRRGSPQLSIRSDLVSRRVPLLVLGFLIVMAVVTVGLALIFNADGARHPAPLGSVVVALLVLTGGPALMAAVRRRAELARR
jgi:hypothetical protein